VEADADKATVSTLKNIGLNLAMLPSEFLFSLQEGVTAEIRAREQHTLSLVSEQKAKYE